jgi:toxin ParE1/3/4
MRVRWMPAASNDLQGIEAYIAEDDPAAAGRVADILYAAVTRLADHPYRGRQGKVSGTRELVLAQLPYVVVYAVSDDLIDVLRIIHGARRWPETQG